MPEDRGKTYLLTAIDRYTRWPEAFAIPNQTAETVAEALYEGWVARFGCPTTVTTDRGSQFESRLLERLHTLLGSNRIRTTAYHPSSNGMVERFHRSLKAALKASPHGWTRALPSALLGLRASVKEDLGCTAADLLYGATLVLPGELLGATSNEVVPREADFASQLKDTMNALVPVPPKQQPPGRQVFVHKDLADCTHVFLRIDRVRGPLAPPYEGPFEVLSRSPKVFVIRIRGKSESVSIDRLKPAFTEAPHAVDDQPVVTLHVNPAPTYTTRAGRRVRFPAGFQNYRD